MEEKEPGRVLVPVTIENLADLVEVRHGRIAASEVRRVEVPDALVVPDVIGLLMPLRLVEKLGLAPVLTRWVAKLYAAGRPFEFHRPIPHRAVLLTIQGRDCVMEVGAIDDHQPVVIGLMALGAMGWVVDIEAGRLIGNPEHGGEEKYDVFSSFVGRAIAGFEQR